MGARTRRRATARRERRSWTKPILAGGALAAALGSIIGLAGTVGSWFGGDPEGVVERLELRGVTPLTYGEWRDHEGVSNKGMPPASLKVPGKLISYDVDTRGYDEDARLPVRIIVHNVTEQKSRTIDADAIRVQAGDDCGCFDWVAAPGNRARYYVEVAIFPPGPIRGQPAKTATTAFFRGV